MNELFKVPTYGRLMMDKILFEASYPILFTCMNEEEDLFLCVCCQNNVQGKKWLVTKTTEKTVIQMLHDEISIREAFLRFPDCRLSICAADEYIVKEQDSRDWGEESLFLPKRDEFMEAEPGEFDEEINYFQTMLPKKQMKCCCNINAIS